MDNGCIGAAKWNNVPVTAFTKEGILFKSFESQKQYVFNKWYDYYLNMIEEIGE